MESFEDALNKHKNNLSADLVGFGEGKRVRKIMMDIDSNSSDYEYYFQAGAQSRQSEVDELKERIDGAIDFLYSSNANDEYYVLQAIKSLKGEANET